MKRPKVRAALVAALCLLLCPACAPEPTPTAPPSASPAPQAQGPAVRTHWDRLTPYAPETPVYTRRYPGFTDSLIPAGDYGVLLPFLGDRLGGTGEGARYGLVTLEGEIVADPVFSDVWDGSTAAGFHDDAPLPYLMLNRGVTTASEDQWPEEEALWAMAARDGSWCTPFRYAMDGELAIWGRSINGNCTEEGLFVLDGEALVYLDGTSGRERFRLEEFPGGMEPYEALWGASWAGGVVTIRALGASGYQIDGRTLAVTAVDGLPQGDVINGRSLEYEGATGLWQLRDTDGAVLLEAPFLQRLTWSGGDVVLDYENVEDGWTGGFPVNAVYDARTLRPVDSPLAGRRVHWFTAGNGWSWYREGADVVFVRGEEVCPFPTPLDPEDQIWGRTFMLPEPGGTYALATLDGAVLKGGMTPTEFYELRGFDLVTGAPYLRVRAGRQAVFYDENGALLASTPCAPNQIAQPAGDRFLITGPTGCVLRDRAGETLFRWLLPAGDWD